MNSQNSWNTASGDKYVIYNNKRKAESVIAIYSQKFIRNLNVYAHLSCIICRLAGRTVVLIFHQSIFYIAS